MTARRPRARRSGGRGEHGLVIDQNGDIKLAFWNEDAIEELDGSQ